MKVLCIYKQAATTSTPVW